MNRAGHYETVPLGVAAYKAYLPNPLPPFPEIEMDAEFIALLAKAHNVLGQLESTSRLLPDVKLFLGSYVRKEALLSSQIEGTQATLEDVLNPDVAAAVNLDVDDVINYVGALNFAIQKMKDLPICNRLLCETHKVLLQGVRGQEKNPGEFRKSQNWIGAAGCTLQNARYVPPTPENMLKCMSELEKFIHESDMDILIKTALAHYQFETIHPFLDGNGRIGRMLIILMLMNEQILSSPILYMSLFLKTNRIEYYDRLSEVRIKGNYEQWIKFFLSGIITTCEDSISTIEKIHEIIDADARKIEKAAGSVKAVFTYLKEHPIVSIGGAAKALGISFNTVSTALQKLSAVGIVTERTDKLRDRVFEYSKYLNVLKSGT